MADRSPIASLTAEEISQTRRLLEAAGLIGATTRFVYVGVAEPAKADVLAWENGAGPCPDREARVMLLDMKDGRSRDVLVCLTSSAVLASKEVDSTEGQLPVSLEEFELVGAILSSDEAWLSALGDRGIDAARVVYNPLSAGWFGLPGEEGRRLLRVTALRMDHAADSPWAHPIDGLSAYVDTIAREVVQVNDIARVPVPAEQGNFNDPAVQGEPLDLRPIDITQPEGPSFQVDGETLTWANWKFNVGFDPREGVVLHQVAFRDGEVHRPIVYRASVAEMVVPYGDPSPARFWQNYFDTGEYLFGRFSNSLVLGCDCLGEITYLDATLSDESGNPRVIRNAICIHEEDYGTLWKHSDLFTGVSEVRRARRLVVSFFTTIGNYDYGFYWYFYLDGTIELEAKLTGIIFTSAYEPGSRFATEMAPGLGAPVHQHLFGARLDMMIDGVANAVDEVDAVRVPVSEENPYGNAFSWATTRLRTESEGGRLADPLAARTWRIVSTERTNRLGNPTSYALHTGAAPVLLADPDSSIAARAAFATKHLWVTQYDKDERFPAGDLVNQHHGGGGIPQFVAKGRSIDGEDIVVWHTFGATHFPRTEDWPVMPVDHAGFKLKPYGFFDRNPALNVPAPHEDHCARDHQGGLRHH
ncbi:MAG: primary-amine oxidase [Trebonia sp.]